MATKIWTGAVSSAWGTAGNWTGGVPANGDNAIISGSVSITGTVLATNLASLLITPDYSGTIGTSELQPLDVAGTKLMIYGGEGAYLWGGFTTTVVACARKTSTGINLVTSSSHGAGSGGNVYISGGNVYIAATLGEVHIARNAGLGLSEPSVRINTANVTRVLQTGGNCRCDNTTNLLCSRGRAEVSEDVTMNRMVLLGGQIDNLSLETMPSTTEDHVLIVDGIMRASYASFPTSRTQAIRVMRGGVIDVSESAEDADSVRFPELFGGIFRSSGKVVVQTSGGFGDAYGSVYFSA